MIVVDGPSSVSADRWLARQNSPGAGVISVVAGPSHAFWALALAILSRLGQREAAEMGTQNDREMLGIWAEAYNVTDVIVNHGDNYPGAVIAMLETVLVEIGARLWLVVEPALVEATVLNLGLESLTPSRLGWAAFERTWREGSERLRTPARRRTKALPPKPADSAVLEQIQGAWRRRRDLPYLEGFCEIANDSEQLRAYVRGARRTDVRQTRLRVAARLRGLGEAHPDPRCFAQAMRGSMVALRRIGWLVALDASALALAAYREPVPKAVGSERLEHILLFRDPQVAAAAALAALELAIDEIAHLRMDDIAEDGSVVRSINDVVPVPPELRPILRAQRISRLRRRAGPGDRLLAGDGQAPTTHRVRMLLQVGLGLEPGSRPWRQVLTSPTRDERWLAERGVTFRRLKVERLLTPERVEADRLRDDAIVALRAGRRNPIVAACHCPKPHSQPELLNETFGARPRQPVSMSHPWRTPW